MEEDNKKLDIVEITNLFILDSIEFVKCVDKLYAEYNELRFTNQEYKEILDQLSSSITSMIDFSEILETHEDTLDSNYKGIFKKTRKILKSTLLRVSTFMYYKKLSDTFIYVESDSKETSKEEIKNKKVKEEKEVQKQIINNYSNFIGDKINGIKETLDEAPKKRRGRPPKKKDNIEENNIKENIDALPAKSWVPNLPKEVQEELKNSDPVQKKRRGRPPKVKPIDEFTEAKIEERKVEETVVEEKKEEPVVERDYKQGRQTNNDIFGHQKITSSEMIKESEKRDLKIRQQISTMRNGTIKNKESEVTDEGYHVIPPSSSLNITRSDKSETSNNGTAKVNSKYANIFKKK